MAPLPSLTKSLSRNRYHIYLYYPDSNAWSMYLCAVYARKVFFDSRGFSRGLEVARDTADTFRTRGFEVIKVLSDPLTYGLKFF